jgi:exosome complex RNA-binding protein Rrp4
MGKPINPMPRKAMEGRDVVMRVCSEGKARIILRRPVEDGSRVSPVRRRLENGAIIPVSSVKLQPVLQPRGRLKQTLEI